MFWLQGGQILLSEKYPGVTLQEDVYNSLIVKSSASATRLIRLLMKSFFTQEELAASSLSGEGIYKKRLQPNITEAIKSTLVSSGVVITISTTRPVGNNANLVNYQLSAQQRTCNGNGNAH
ncbi:hypothetical protein Ciccas_013638, partial [Cichlidogyrus casuarinus]